LRPSSKTLAGDATALSLSQGLSCDVVIARPRFFSVRTICADGFEAALRMSRRLPMSQLADFYVKTRGVAPDVYEFRLRGVQLRTTDTVDSLSLTTNEFITARVRARATTK
jgi:hypothetical protein